jgi:ABC-2 type transport system permease protein
MMSRGNPAWWSIRLGMGRGWIETRNQVRNVEELSFNIFFALAFAVVLFFQRNTIVEGTGQSLASLVLPGILGMMVAWAGFSGAAGLLSVEREDGTLLRAKAIPHGMAAYVCARVVLLSLTTAVSLLIIFVAGLLFVPELLTTPVTGWLIMIGVLALGLVATLPWGAILGSLVKSPQLAFALTMLPIGVLTVISGIFYPVTAMAQWVQNVAQVFPVYWLGHGMRAALQPEAVAAEIGGVWRYPEMVGVLGAWAVVGLLIAPTVLRRMARRESGSAVEERRQQAMQRYG